jgi:hypothetical protein
MTGKKNLFRRVFEAIVEGRNARAQRQIDEYVRSHKLERPRRTER